MLAKVSTLFTIVGFPNNPFTAGNGGRGRGSPRCPSILSSSAVSSPQTNAPAPKRRSKSKEKLLPKIFFPRTPSSRACLIAIRNRLTAIGYSART